MMKKALCMGLFFYVLGAEAMEMQELSQWNEKEMTDLQKNEEVRECLLNNGIVKYIGSALLGRDERRMILERLEFGPRRGVFYFQHFWNPHVDSMEDFESEARRKGARRDTRDCSEIKEYLETRLHSFWQAVLLKKLAVSLAPDAPLSTEPISNFEVEKFQLSDFRDDERPLFKAYQLLPKRVKLLASDYWPKLHKACIILDERDKKE